jgi:prepilin-type processing-associated H-X9-DG protein
MDGSAASLIAIPIVATLALAAWLLLVAYAVARPQWKHGTAAAARGNPALADGHVRPAEPRPAGLAVADADQDAIPEMPAKLAA